MAGYLEVADITTPQSLIGQNAFDMYNKLCKKTGKKFDPCVIDVFMSVIDFMEGGEPREWWDFTCERKKLSLED